MLVYYGLMEALESVLRDAKALFGDTTTEKFNSFIEDLGIVVSNTVSFNVLDRIFNNMSIATIPYYKENASNIFSNANVNYNTPVCAGMNGAEVIYKSNDGSEFLANIWVTDHKVKLRIESAWRTKDYRLRFLLYNKDFVCGLNKITVRENSSNLLCIVKNMNYVQHVDVEEDTDSYLTLRDEFSDGVGYDDYSTWVTVDFSQLRWATNTPPDTLSLGLMVEKKFGDKIYQRYYNLGTPPNAVILI